MNIYRIIRNKHLKDDLKGIGASIAPGRWNKKDIPCIYAAESRALALVEHMANVTNEGYTISSFTIRSLYLPDDCIIKINIDKLPQRWRDRPPPVETRDFGTYLLQSKKALAYMLPSTIIPQEFNVIIDPNHSDISKLKILDEHELEFDHRLKY